MDAKKLVSDCDLLFSNGGSVPKTRLKMLYTPIFKASLKESCGEPLSLNFACSMESIS